MISTTIASFVVALFLAFAAWVGLSHWAGAIANGRNRSRGIDRGHSMVPLVAQLIVAIAALIELCSGAVIPAFVFWIVALADLSLWVYLYLPIFLIRRRLRARRHGRSAAG